MDTPANGVIELLLFENHFCLNIKLYLESKIVGNHNVICGLRNGMEFNKAEAAIKKTPKVFLAKWGMYDEISHRKVFRWRYLLLEVFFRVWRVSKFWVL